MFFYINEAEHNIGVDMVVQRQSLPCISVSPREKNAAEHKSLIEVVKRPVDKHYLSFQVSCRCHISEIDLKRKPLFIVLSLRPTVVNLKTHTVNVIGYMKQTDGGTLCVRESHHAQDINHHPFGSSISTWCYVANVGHGVLVET